MKRFLFLIILGTLIGFENVSGQGHNIAITPIVPDEIDLTEGSKSALQQRLLQMVTLNGFGSYSNDFILTANLIPISKNIIPGTSPQVSVHLEVSVYLVGVAEQVILDEYSLEVKGVAKNDNQAMAKAIKQINPRKPEIRAFMSTAREKIEKYYIERTPALIAKAQMLANREEYEKALAVLSSVPESVSEYLTVVDMMTSIHQQMIDKEAVRLIQYAKNNIIKKNYSDALDDLFLVDPMSTKAPEAQNIINQIKAKIEEQDRLAYEAKLREQDAAIEAARRTQDNAELNRKAHLDASYKVAEEESKSGFESLKSEVKSWLFGKLI